MRTANVIQSINLPFYNRDLRGDNFLEDGHNKIDKVKATKRNSLRGSVILVKNFAQSHAGQKQTMKVNSLISQDLFSPYFMQKTALSTE